MINQVLMYGRTCNKLIDNATRAVEIAVEQSESVALLGYTNNKW